MKADTGVKLATKDAANKEKANENNHRRLKQSYNNDANNSEAEQCTHVPVTAEIGDELRVPRETPDNVQPEETDDDTVIDETKDDTKADALDGGWGWFIVFGTFLIHMITGGIYRTSGVVYLEMLERYQQSATATAWVLALCSTLTLIMGPVASALCNKFSVRLVVMFGGALSMVGILVSGFSPNLWFLYFTYGIVTGFGRAMVYCPCLIIVGYYFNKRRGLAVGLATCGGGIGSFFFSPLFENMFEVYGFAGTLLVMSAINFHFMIAGALFRPLDLQQKLVKLSRRAVSKDRRSQSNCRTTEHISDGTKADEQSSVKNDAKQFTLSDNNTTSIATRRKPSLSKRKLSKVKMVTKSLETTKDEKKPLLELALFKNYAFTTMCIQSLMNELTTSLTFIFLPALAETRGLTKLQGAYMLSILGICDSVSRILMSTLLDLKRVKKYRLVIYNILIVMIGMVSVVVPLMETFPQFAVLCMVYGSLSGTYVSQKSVVLVDILGVEKLSSAFGLVLMFEGLGTAIGPTLGGLFKDFLGSYEMSFFCGSGGMFLGGVVMATGNVWLYLQHRKAATSNTDNLA